MSCGPQQILNLVRIGGYNVIAKTIGCPVDGSDSDIWLTVEPFKVDTVTFENRVSSFLYFDIKIGAGTSEIIYLKREW